ncbi:MAG: Uma2 family endonuclease [Methylobacteriaceae bacterium]|nr:Uma2 family endonuclease [Methylobacteriaceae bacterium]
MNVDEFLAWARDRPGRYELVRGEVVAMSPQRVRHATAKFAAQSALDRALERAGLPCRMLPDGMTVRIDSETAYEPDALVYCGPPLGDDVVEVPKPIIVVEVLSPGTTLVDTGEKFSGYFSVASVRHYLVINPVTKVVVHHARGEGNLISSRFFVEGTLYLDPPGLDLPVTELFPRA